MSTPQARAFTFRSRESIIEFLRAWNYRVQPTPFDLPPDFPTRAQELINNLELLASYDSAGFPFQIFLVELNVPRTVKRVRKTDLRTILDPFYRRYPQGDYLFIFALPNYSSVALVSPKRIRDDVQKYRTQILPMFPEMAPQTPAPDATAIKTQLRILTLDPQHLYHTDEWVLDQIRLEPHEQDATTIWNKHLAAFDVERVTKRFYENYVTVLESLKAELTRQRVQGADAKKIHAFAEQLLNRVMFLYFVQRKHWLRWADGTPDPRFLRNLWHKYRETKHGGNFYARWLAPLFFGAFNRDRARVLAARLPRDIEDAFLNRMPYLNGGLFEPNELDALNFTVPDLLFTYIFDRLNNEEPGFLERYNFTVDESTALEVEVAVDPEMLGKVYESQVQQEERHGAGIFYTPRAEIDYMCRLSLVEYLHTRTHIGKDELIPLVFEPRRLVQSAENESPLFDKTSDEKRLRAIESALKTIRVCDGAVGSGSFLVGMMKVLAELQQAIAERLERKRLNEFDLKRRIIMENLYGVDVKDWAVRVCELRLWLALTIEAGDEQIGLYTQPILPKLSFRIRAGDSLVEEVAETPLALRGAGRIPHALEKRSQRLAQDKAEFFRGTSHTRLQIIEQEEHKLLTSLLSEQIARLDAQIQELRGEQLGLAGIADERTRKKMDDPRRARVKELTARRDALIKARTRLTTGKTQPFFIWEIGFGEVFIENGGFDIFIGNPPYVRQEEIAPPTKNPDDYDADEWRIEKQNYKEQLARGVRALWGEATKIDRKSDLYVYFYYTGLSLLREGGIFCFINSNSWLDVDYGAELQEFLLRNMRILQIIDNHSERSFEQADVNTVIVLLQRPTEDEGRKTKDEGWNHVAKFVAYKKPFEEVLTVPNLLAIERATEITRTDDYRVYPVTQRDLFIEGAEDSHLDLPLAEEETEGVETLKYTGGKWGGKYLRAPDIFFKILEKGKGKLVRLGEIAEVRRGFTTGANEFFYLEDITDEAREKPPRAGLRYCKNGAGWEGWLEEEFLKPVIVSMQQIESLLIRQAITSRVLVCREKLSQLRARNKEYVLGYIAYGAKLKTKKKAKHTIGGIPLPEAATLRGRSLWYALPDVGSGDIIIPRLIRERFFIAYNVSHLEIGDMFFLGRFLRNHQTKIGVALLNCTLTYLLIELVGRINVPGRINFYGPEIKTLVIPNPNAISVEVSEKIWKAFMHVARRQVLPISEEIKQSDRVEFDRCVLSAYGLEHLQDEIYHELVVHVQERLKKEHSLKPRNH